MLPLPGGHGLAMETRTEMGGHGLAMETQTEMATMTWKDVVWLLLASCDWLPGAGEPGGGGGGWLVG